MTTDQVQNKVKNRKSVQEYTYNCIDCGKEVSISLGNLLFYDDKGLVIPCRCKECKDAKNVRVKSQETK